MAASVLVMTLSGIFPLKGIPREEATRPENVQNVRMFVFMGFARLFC